MMPTGEHSAKNLSWISHGGVRSLLDNLISLIVVQNGASSWSGMPDMSCVKPVQTLAMKRFAKQLSPPLCQSSSSPLNRAGHVPGETPN